jgi:FkbM family methyltransferase
MEIDDAICLGKIASIRKMNYAPVVLFVYNRPEHTLKTLEALSKNQLANESLLYIFADGPKENADENDLRKIIETRDCLRSRRWCKDVIIKENEINLGLANSIIAGVTEVVNRHGNIIVLEDDLVTSIGFLKYMNSALSVYKSEKKVMHISGYMFPVKGKLPETFFYRQASCWGWGTWSDRWNMIEKSPGKLMKELLISGKINNADIDGTNQFVEYLKGNIDGRLKTWAVLWHFSVFLNNGLCLHPGKSLVKNIGMDNSGSNCENTNLYDVELVEYIRVKKIKIKDFQKVYKYLKTFYKPSNNAGFLHSTSNKIKALVPPEFKRHMKMLISKEFKETELEKSRIQNLHRYTEADISFLGKKIKIVDIDSFEFNKKEIFDQQIYKFNSNKEEPYIIDCGANIGLSIIYFKELFPKAKIIGFEPDAKIFNKLLHNIGSFNLTNVELVEKACWNEETTLQFYSEGADGGRVAKDLDKDNLIEVKTIRLRNLLNSEVDFLKIDIEGAEFLVLEDCKDLLRNVKNLFVEYHSFLHEEQRLDNLLALIKNAGFRYAIQQHGVVSKLPFKNIELQSGMDTLLNISAYRNP